MLFEDRLYQTEAADSGADFLLNGKGNGLIVMPTGSGKSRILAMIAERVNAPILVFQPSKEILAQNLEKFRSYGYEPGIFSASGPGGATQAERKERFPVRRDERGRRLCRACDTPLKPRRFYCSEACQKFVEGEVNPRTRIADITLATIGSVTGAKGEKVQRASKAQLFVDFPYIIVDECHEVSAKGGGYKSFFGDVPARILGLTATPFRMASNREGTEMRWLTRTKPRIFSEVVYYAQIRDLMDEGYLVKPEYQIVKGFNRHKLHANSKGSDYTDSSVQKHLFEIGFDQRLEEVMRRLIHKVGRKHILVFTRFVQDAENLVKVVEGGAVVSDKTRNRGDILRRFHEGDLRYIVNCRVLDTGYDFPELDTVVDSQVTLSLKRQMQKYGRLVRPHPDKKDAWLVDMVGGVERFGKLEDIVIHEDPWRMLSGDRALTNSYLTDTGKQKCDRCGSSQWFWARHVDPPHRANRLARPANGVLPNINLKRVGGKTLYEIVKPGDGEFVAHPSICPGRRPQ